MPRISVGAVVAAGVVLVGCHTITEELPTQPTETNKPAGTGTMTVSIPALALATTTPAPAPAATPVPEAPAPDPAPTPEPATPPPPDAGGCGEPLPPAIRKLKVKVHIRGANKETLDSTPLVAGSDYCAQIGFLDGRGFCPVRPEGHPERVACEIYAVGMAKDTGRPGPTWKGDGRYCTDGSGCENHPDNQYLLWVYWSGHYEACTQDGVCGSVDVTR
jgi:hypothetical protein